VAGASEYGIEPSCSIKGGEFHEQLSDYRLLKKDCAPVYLVDQSDGHPVTYLFNLLYPTLDEG
jgi:hypothetical protein